MGSERKKYDSTFKRESVHLADSSEKTDRQIPVFLATRRA